MGNTRILKTNNIYKNRFDLNDAEYTGTKIGEDAVKMKEIEEALIGIEGQEYACQCVKEYLFGINNRSQEKGLGGSFVFAGPPAVGKTILAERIAKCLKRPFMRIDMGTKSDKDSGVFDLFGIHPSYKSAEEGELTKFVKNHPVSVVLLDEIEKAHPSVLNTLFQVYERGEVEDKFTKRLVNFRDVIFIVTTNVGKDIYNKEIGKYIFSAVSPSTISKALYKEENPMTRAPFFSEPLVSRFNSGKVIMFNKLRPEVIHKIVCNDMLKQTEYLKNTYGLSVDLDIPMLTQLLIFNQGERADIRTLLKASRDIFSKSLSCGVETATDNGAELLFNRLSFEISLNDADEKTKALFDNRNKSRVLVYCKEKQKNIFSRFESEKVEIIYADNSYDAKKLSKIDATAVIIDVENQEDKTVRKLFDYSALQEEIPTYVYNTKKVGKSAFYYYINNGSSGCYSPAFENRKLEDFVGKIIGGLDLSYMTQTLFRCANVINFDVDYEYKNDSVTVHIHNLRTETAMDANDESAFVSEREIPNVTYDDIIGGEEVKKELKRAAKYLRDYKKYRREGARIPRGLFLYGPPGTGKTMLGKAFAQEAGLPFIQKNASEFLIKWIGDGAKAVREMFASARRYSPCVLFVDEIDIIAKSRENDPSDQHHTHNITNTFLSELDGFKDNTGAPVFVICATNFSARRGETKLDEAFLRRFDRKMELSLPKCEERELFLTKETDKLAKSKVSMELISSIAKRSIGWNLADLSLVIQNAVRKFEDEYGTLGINDFYLKEEFENYADGEKKENSPEDMRKTAVHEAGHALVGALLGMPTVYATIVSRGDYGGYVYHGDENKTTLTKTELLNRICMALAGRGAEVTEYGEDGIGTGASADLQTASRVAMSMVTKYGMLGDDLLFVKEDSEFAENKVRQILNEQYRRAKEIIGQNKEKFDRMVFALLEKNSLDENEIKEIAKG